MTRRAFPLILVTSLLAACTATTVAPRPEPSARPATTKARPSASPAAAPARATLLRPLPGGRALSGEVRVDAAYFAGTTGTLIGAGATQAVASRNATIVAAGAGNAVPARLVGPDGASLIGMDGATLIGPDGATLVGAAGGALVGPDGASLIGMDGPSRTSLSSGAFLRPGDRASYRLPFGLRQAAQALDLGEIRPAAGFLLVALSLRDGKPLAIGQDPAGQPVYGAWTDAAGRFGLSLPAEVTQNVRLLAIAAGSGDAKLAYAGVVRPQASELAMDEVASTVAGYLRTSFTGQLDGLALDDTLPDLLDNFDGDARTAAFVTEALARPRDAARAAGVASWPAAHRAGLASRLADILLARVDLDEAIVDAKPDVPGMKTEKALVALDAVMREMRDAVTAKMRAEVAAGRPADGPFLAAMRPYDPQAKLVRPSDFPDFLAAKVLTGRRLSGWRMAEDVQALNVAIGLGVPETSVKKLRYAVAAIGNGIGLTLVLPSDEPGGSVMDALVRAIETYPKP